MDDEQPMLRWDEAWCVQRASAGELVICAGADRRLAADGLANATIETAEAWAAGGRIAGDGGGEVSRLLDRLTALGVVRLAGTVRSSVELVGVGGRPGDTGVVTAFAAELRRHDIAVAASGPRGVIGLPPPLMVALRLGPGAVDVATTHLVVDLRLHHTVVIGPLVVPGVTACAGCLDRRVARRWAEPPLPARPAVQTLLPAVTALTAVQIRLAVEGTSSLANATATWDLEQATCTREPLWKTPGCPRCDTPRAVGRVTLPWVAEDTKDVEWDRRAS